MTLNLLSYCIFTTLIWLHNNLNLPTSTSNTNFHNQLTQPTFICMKITEFTMNLKLVVIYSEHYMCNRKLIKNRLYLMEYTLSSKIQTLYSKNVTFCTHLAHHRFTTYTANKTIVYFCVNF